MEFAKPGSATHGRCDGVSCRLLAGGLHRQGVAMRTLKHLISWFLVLLWVVSFEPACVGRRQLAVFTARTTQCHTHLASSAGPLSAIGAACASCDLGCPRTTAVSSDPQTPAAVSALPGPLITACTTAKPAAGGLPHHSSIHLRSTILQI
jgi:hypothetical protein